MNQRKTPLPEPTLSATNKGQPFSRARAVRLTRDGRRALNEIGPQLSSELGSRHRRMRFMGPTYPYWPEVDLLHSFGGRREAPPTSGPKANGLRYAFQRCHVVGC